MLPCVSVFKNIIGPKLLLKKKVLIIVFFFWTQYITFQCALYTYGLSALIHFPENKNRIPPQINKFCIKYGLDFFFFLGMDVNIFE